MHGQWFYGRGSDINGPVSGQQLSDLAAGGQIIPTDTIWRDNVEEGVQAGKVKNLFREVVAVTESGAPASKTLSLADDLGAVGLVSLSDDLPPSEAVKEIVPTATPEVAPPPKSAPVRTARATAGKGAVIVGQDGKNVKFRGKCATCGREDSSFKSMAIPRGMARASFFCAKCRKRSDIEIFGIM
jgi:GYF domain 2